MLRLTIHHNIHLTREQRYALHNGEDLNVIGVSIPIWLIKKGTSEPANEIFCRYYLKNPKIDTPIKIFDDGEFTYMQFRDKNMEIPAIFAVDENLRESMVNFKLDPSNSNLIIIEQVFQKLTLRSGKKIVCVFNEAFRPF